eukprot:Amastigsp_a7301_6.p2 type:complete len:115 gc:universal Amastigsp_a7301_6:102-446(+)
MCPTTTENNANGNLVNASAAALLRLPRPTATTRRFSTTTRNSGGYWAWRAGVQSPASATRFQSQSRKRLSSVQPLGISALPSAPSPNEMDSICDSGIAAHNAARPTAPTPQSLR